jgi:hypothetical protein
VTDAGTLVEVFTLCASITQADGLPLLPSVCRTNSRSSPLSWAHTPSFWHDGQAGQARCSTGSVFPDELPFRGTYVVVDQLGPVVEGFLADSMPSVVAWSDLDDAESRLEQAMAEPESTPWRVWTSSVGTSH